MKHRYLVGVWSNRKLKNLKTKLYVAYHSMRQRCLNPKHTSFKNYGGRGIKICARWLKSFLSFAIDVGLPPSPRHTLGRIDNFKNYTPGNVAWQTRREQQQNTRANNRLEVNGQNLCLMEWSRKTGISMSGLRSRKKRGVDLDKMLAPVVRPVVEIAGIKMPRSWWAKKIGITKQALAERMAFWPKGRWLERPKKPNSKL